MIKIQRIVFRKIIENNYKRASIENFYSKKEYFIMNKHLRSKEEINNDINDLFKEYYNRRLGLKWLIKFISLKSEYQGDKWTYTIPTFFVIVFCFIFLIIEQFRLQVIIQVSLSIYFGIDYNNFSLVKYAEFIVFFLLISILFDYSEKYIPPLLLALRKYKLKTAKFDELKYVKGSNGIVFLIYIVILLLLKLYSPISSQVPFVVLMLDLLLVVFFLLLILFPGYLLNGILHELTPTIHSEETNEEDYILHPYSTITEDIELGILFLFEKKRSFIHDNQDNVAYFKGFTTRDIKFLFMMVFSATIVLFLILLIDSSKIMFVYFSYIVIFISSIGYLVYYDNIQNLIVIKFLKKRSIKINMKVYSQTLSDINLDNLKIVFIDAKWV